MPNEVRLREVVLGPDHVATGNTRHSVGGELMPRPAVLRIVRYEGAAGFYLLYLDETGEEMTDTWHQTLDDAMSQAEFEFNVAASDWHRIAD